MDIKIRFSRGLRQAVVERLQRAYEYGQVRLVRRIHALLSIIEGKSVDEVASMLDLGTQAVRDYVNAFLYRGVASLSYQKPAGRPPKLTKTQQVEYHPHYVCESLDQLGLSFQKARFASDHLN